MKVGVMIIGIHGASASTFVAGYLQYRNDKAMFGKGSYWCSVAGDFPDNIYDMALGGWDYRFGKFNDAVSFNNLITWETPEAPIDYYSAILGPSDYGVLEEGKDITHFTLSDAIKSVRENIQEFRLKNHLDKVIVLNSSSPKYCENNVEAGWSSNQAYSEASVLEGADWIEFTPSDSITPELIALATRNGSRLAGRDGSTGQTILKLFLRDYFQTRGLAIESWYSTNLIGNHDGEVLRHSEFNRTKFLDKLGVLPESLHENHIVEIQFVPSAGDNKESWDCIYFTGWLDAKMSLRINWHGRDSFLAAPLMLDIIAGLIHAERNQFPYGVVESLSIFFKNPIGQSGQSFDEYLRRFRDFAK